jgi:alpha-tubulin suppressor-like RCC1 family protein
VGNSTVSQSVVGLSDVIAIAGGGFQSVAVTSDGAVWAWGSNSPVPVVVTGLGAGSGVIAVAAGTGHNLALKSDGSVVAWGSNAFGQLGVSGIATSSGPGSGDRAGAGERRNCDQRGFPSQPGPEVRRISCGLGL